MTADFPIGCKRVLLSDDFFSTLARDNVTLVTDPIEQFTRSGIRTAADPGKEVEHPADVIVYATGFDTQGHHLEDRVVGPGGRSLREVWADAPMAYEGCMVAGFPNYHFVTGPNTGVGSTSVIFMIEQAANLILQCIEATGENGLIAPTEQAMRSYDREIQAALAGTKRYESNDKIFGISGYTIPLPKRILASYPYDNYFFSRICSWGWATWKRAWNLHDNDLRKLLDVTLEKGMDLKQGGSDIPDTLTLCCKESSKTFGHYRGN